VLSFSLHRYTHVYTQSLHAQLATSRMIPASPAATTAQ